MKDFKVCPKAPFIKTRCDPEDRLTDKGTES